MVLSGLALELMLGAEIRRLRQLFGFGEEFYLEKSWVSISSGKMVVSSKSCLVGSGLCRGLSKSCVEGSGSLSVSFLKSRTGPEI